MCLGPVCHLPLCRSPQSDTFPLCPITAMKRSKDGVGCLGVAVVGGWRGEGAGEFGLNRAVTN